MDRVRVGICGTGKIAQTHAMAIQRCPGAQLVAVCSRTKRNAQAFAAKFEVPNVFADYQELTAHPDVDAVLVAYPNSLHYDAAMAAIRNNRAVWVEKPLTSDLLSAKRLAAEAIETGVAFNYLEELPFAPRMSYLIDASMTDAFGELHFARALMRHDGPYSEWFFDRETAGGGALIDLGCHAIEMLRRLFAKRPVVSVSANIGAYHHLQRGPLEDFSIVTMEFDNGAIAVAEGDWCLKGAYQCRAEAYGDKGFGSVDLGRDKSHGIDFFSMQGYGEEPDKTRGFSWPNPDPITDYGYLAQIKHCVDCVNGKASPKESVSDALVVMEIMAAAYHSARIGEKVSLPFTPDSHEFLVDLWWEPAVEE